MSVLRVWTCERCGKKDSTPAYGDHSAPKSWNYATLADGKRPDLCKECFLDWTDACANFMKEKARA